MITCPKQFSKIQSVRVEGKIFFPKISETTQIISIKLCLKFYQNNPNGF